MAKKSKPSPKKKKPKTEQAAPPEIENGPAKPECFRCDGTAMLCNNCGESAALCNGEECEGDFRTCEDCGGTGGIHPSQAALIETATPDIIAENDENIVDGSFTIVPEPEPEPEPEPNHIVEAPPAAEPEPEPARETPYESVQETAERQARERIRREMELEEYDRETLQLLNLSAADVSSTETAYNDAHATAARAKKKWEQARDEHFQLIRDRAEGRGKPIQPVLFKRDPEHGTYTNADPDTDLPPDEWEAKRGRRETPEAVCNYEQPTPNCTETAEECLAWRDVTLAELVEKDDLPQKVADILGSNGIDTLGKIGDYVKPNGNGYCRDFTDIDGIGPKKRDQISDASFHFFQRWPHDERNTSRNKPKDSTKPIGENHVGEPSSTGSEPEPSDPPGAIEPEQAATDDAGIESTPAGEETPSETGEPAEQIQQPESTP